jgi:hypothetical protein
MPQLKLVHLISSTCGCFDTAADPSPDTDVCNPPCYFGMLPSPKTRFVKKGLAKHAASESQCESKQAQEHKDRLLARDEQPEPVALKLTSNPPTTSGSGISYIYDKERGLRRVDAPLIQRVSDMTEKLRIRWSPKHHAESPLAVDAAGP